MTVRKLIALLAKYPPSTKIYLASDPEGNTYMEVAKVIEGDFKNAIIFPDYGLVAESELYDLSDMKQRIEEWRRKLGQSEKTTSST